MKNQRIFPGIILIGFGVFFFWQQAEISLFAEFITWPTLINDCRNCLFCQGYGGKDYESILPGVILTGFGFIFTLSIDFPSGQIQLVIFILIIALGFLLRYQKLGTGFFHGILFLALAGLLLFYDKVMSWFGLLETNIATFAHFGPLPYSHRCLLIIFQEKISLSIKKKGENNVSTFFLYFI